MTAETGTALRLDRMDLKILSALQMNGRITNQRLADTVGLSPSACLERVRRLQGAKIILGYTAELDLARLGKPLTVFAEVALDHHGGQRTFEERLAEIEEAVECFEISGAYDYLVRFVCSGIGDYQQLTGQMLNDPRWGVRQITSLVTMRSVFRRPARPRQPDAAPA
ncbi:MAG: Lrp/AsnC family transcriptional regulator [Alphaproteobacteria bacterium]